MASSLASHLCAFLFFFFPIGVRRLVAFLSLYLKNSHHHHQFRSKPWYLLHSSSTPCFDLYIILITIPIASFSDLYLFFSILPHRFYFLHHQSILTFFWLLLLILLTYRYPPLLLLPDNFLFFLASAAFLVDYYFINNNNDDISISVSSVVYNLSGVLSLLCAASCIYLSVCPYSFLAEFALSAGLVFKGTWVMQAGLNLYSNVFGFKGCQKIVTGQMGDVMVKCDLQEDTLRAVALIHLLFVCHSIGILVATFALFAFLSASNCAAAGLSRDATGPLLQASDQLEQPPDSVQFEIE